MDMAMKYHEKALERAADANKKGVIREISKQLVRVYKNIAEERQEKEDFDQALQFYEKCLESCEEAKEYDQEAECYFQIGLIHEKMEDLGEAVLNVTKYLDKSGDDKKR